MTANVFVYELWRVSAQTSPDKNRLWKTRRILLRQFASLVSKCGLTNPYHKYCV